jgi:hypothetical protein
MPITINGSGTVTGITAGGLPDGVITTDDIAASAITRAKMGYAGAILQVVQTVKTDTFSTTTSGQNVFVTISGLSASITPSASSSKVLILVELCGSGLGGSGTLCSFKVQRGGSDISGMLGNARSNFYQSTASNIRAVSDFNSSFRHNITYLDSPASTSSLTYQVIGQAESSGFCINRSLNDAGSTNFSGTQISTVTLMEVAG